MHKSIKGARKERKNELAKSKAISCGHCPFHRGENRGRIEKTWKRYRKAQYRIVDKTGLSPIAL
jgi:hypothetical protein